MTLRLCCVPPTGRKIAIDASMCIYQFLIAVRQDGNVLQNEDGETTRYNDPHPKMVYLKFYEKLQIFIQKLQNCYAILYTATITP